MGLSLLHSRFVRPFFFPEGARPPSRARARARFPPPSPLILPRQGPGAFPPLRPLSGTGSLKRPGARRGREKAEAALVPGPCLDAAPGFPGAWKGPKSPDRRPRGHDPPGGPDFPRAVSRFGAAGCRRGLSRKPGRPMPLRRGRGDSSSLHGAGNFFRPLRGRGVVQPLSNLCPTPVQPFLPAPCPGFCPTRPRKPVQPPSWTTG
jgi:hypothetical protein